MAASKRKATSPRKPAAPKAAKPPKAQRPHMPGYGLPKGTRGLLKWSWALQRLTRSHNYWVTTVRPDGRPHTMPVWGVWLDGAFYFSTGKRSVKTRNLAKNSHCIVCTERPEQAVIVEGVAHAVTGADFEWVVGPYRRKYQWDIDPGMGPLFCVQPTVVFGLDERRFAAGATKWVF